MHLRVLILCLTLAVSPVAAQQLTWRTRADFFADNTEFFTPYRVGETIFGARLRSWLEVEPGERTRVSLGVSADRRWGSGDFADSLKPLLSFRYQGRHSRATLGTLDAENRHGLLDPLMVSTRELVSPVEYGGQWQEKHAWLRSDVWLNWQQLNTPTQREGFEVGAVLSLPLTSALELQGQHLWSHRGGQLFDAGVPVSNNRVSALGLRLSHRLPELGRVNLSAHQLWSRGHLDPPTDDSRPARGQGTLLRVGVEPRGIAELFLLHWRGRDFAAAAGDANYGSQGHNLDFYRSQRRYTEIGLIRHSRIEADISLDAELRFHRIDQEQSVAFFGTPWEISYRLGVTVPLKMEKTK